jgi:hypothetical protein
MTITVDIEPTNRCNAYCTFCPRDNMPDQGLMSTEVFEQALARSVELRAVQRSLGLPSDFTMTFCGLGEPLLNRHTVDFVRKATNEGFVCAMSSNGALLDRRKAHDLLEAGLRRIAFNIGAVDEEYEEVYRLPFPRTRDNILGFRELAGETCDVAIMLVDYKRDPSHRTAMHRYWRDRGIAAFVNPGFINRAGALVVDDMEFEKYAEVAEARALLEDAGITPVCPSPFAYLFVGYDGQYYLDHSDWKKEVPLGSVFDVSFTAIMAAKLAHVRSREPVCKACTLDPINLVAHVLRRRSTTPLDQHADELRAVVGKVRRESALAIEAIDALADGTVSRADAPRGARRA